MVLPDQKKTIAKIFNKDSQIVNYPENNFTQNNRVEEYLDYLNEDGLSEVVGASVMKVYFAAMIAKMAYDFYQQNFSKLAKQCKGLPGKEKTICILHAKARAKKAEAGKLKSGISKCAKAKNPEKCKATLQNKFNQATATMKLSLARAAQLKKR